MAMVLTGALLLVLESLILGAEVKIVMEGEPWNKEDPTSQITEAPQIWYSSEELCTTHKTCSDCIGSNGRCAWCASKDMNYTAGGKKRCNVREIIKVECGADIVDIPEILSKDDSMEQDLHIRPGIYMYTSGSFGVGRDMPYVEYKFYDLPESVQVTYNILCPGEEQYEGKNFCTDVKKGNEVDYNFYFNVPSCPENRDEWNPIMHLHIVNGGELLKINLHMICECDCQKPGNKETYSPKCSRRGTYQCGVCSCYGNRYGKQCECEGKPSWDYDDDDINKSCIAPGDDKICSGRGRCGRCGICECFNKTSVTGRFCECDSYSCPRSEDGQMCGGKDHGKCVCGKCECTDEWTGTACDCTKDIEACRSPYNGLICHGFGECKCGKCQCFEKDGNLRRGQFCQDCSIITAIVLGAKYCTILSFALASLFIWKPQTMIHKKDNSGVASRLGFHVNQVAQNYCKLKNSISAAPKTTTGFTLSESSKET